MSPATAHPRQNTGHHAGAPVEDTTPMAHPLEVRVFRTIDEVESLRRLWTSWQHDASADIDFYLPMLQRTKECLGPYIFVLHRDGFPQAMLIGKLENRGVSLKIGYWRLWTPRARMLEIICGGLVGDQSPANCKALAEAVQAALRAGEADYALLNKLKADSPIISLSIDFAGPLFRDYLAGRLLHCSMKLPSDMDTVYRGLSSDHRGQVRRKVRKVLAEHGDHLNIVRYKQPDELDRMIADMERVAKKTYQRGLGVGFENSPEMRERLAMAAQKGWLRAYVLYLNDQPAAFWMGILFNGVFRSDYLGYDPVHEDLSLGTFLLTKMLEDFCQDGVREIDFGYGAERYKQQFANCRWHETIVHVFAPTMTGFGLNVLRTLVLVTDRLIRKGLDRVRLLPKMKKSWRLRVRTV